MVNARARMLSAAALCLTVLVAAPVGLCAQADSAEDQAVMQALDAFLNGWNSRDARQYAAALHFPHVIFEGGTPRVTSSEAEFLARGSELWASAQPEWDRTQWEERRIVQRLPGVVHVAGRWARLDKSGRVLGRADVLYVVANKNGRWAIAARSGSRSAQGAVRRPQ